MAPPPASCSPDAPFYPCAMVKGARKCRRVDYRGESCLSDMRGQRLPAMHRAIDLPVDWQVGPFIRVLGRERLVDVHAQTGRVAWMHHAVVEAIVMGKNAVGLIGVAHVFLNAEIVH